MQDSNDAVLTTTILNDDEGLTLGQLCRTSAVHAEAVHAMVDEGILEPVSADVRHWRFPGSSIRRVRIVVRLQRELGVNLAGAALALELIDRIERLRRQLRR